MTDLLVRTVNERSAIRRASPLRCEAVSLDSYRILGREVLDVSATGLLLRTDGHARENEVVLLHLFAGDQDIVAEAHVTRVVAGRRRGDRFLGLGLSFSRVPSRPLRDLLRRLRGTPPPVPCRRLRADYAATVRSISAR